MRVVYAILIFALFWSMMFGIKHLSVVWSEYQAMSAIMSFPKASIEKCVSEKGVWRWGKTYGTLNGVRVNNVFGTCDYEK